MAERRQATPTGSTSMPAAPAGLPRVGAAADGPTGLRGSVCGVVLAGQVGLFGLALFVVVESLRLGLWADLGPGPGFFPFVLGVGLGLLCLAWFTQSLRAGGGGTAGTAVPVRQAGVVLGSLVVLAAVMGLLGFQLSVFGFLLFHLRWRARRGWVFSVALALVGSVGVFTGFTQGLLVTLPQSSIPALSNLGL